MSGGRRSRCARVSPEVLRAKVRCLPAGANHTTPGWSRSPSAASITSSAQISFSRWANVVYAPRGVSVTAVCPGFVHTNFHERLGLPPGREGVPAGMWLDAEHVVREGLRDAARGRSVSVPSLRYRVLVAASRLLPDAVVVRAASRGR